MPVNLDLIEFAFCSVSSEELQQMLIMFSVGTKTFRFSKVLWRRSELFLCVLLQNKWSWTDRGEMMTEAFPFVTLSVTLSLTYWNQPPITYSLPTTQLYWLTNWMNKGRNVNIYRHFSRRPWTKLVPDEWACPLCPLWMPFPITSHKSLCNNEWDTCSIHRPSKAGLSNLYKYFFGWKQLTVVMH